MITHRGRTRASNEDAVSVDGMIFAGSMRAAWSARLDAEPHTILVADGIGGQTAGAFASRAAIEFMARRSGALGDIADCEQALHAANEHLYELMTTPDRVEMGTTVVGLALRQRSIVHFNVGDSRVYRHGRRAFRQLSVDDRDRDGPSHAIIQAIGGSLFPLAIVPHVGTDGPLRPDERLLLCSDGLTDMVDERAIREVLVENPSPAEAVEVLFAVAMGAGGHDNITVVVVAPT